MDLSELKPPEGARTKKKRLGRGPGSTVGKTSGRGQKGQKARSGGNVHPRFEGGQMPLFRRLPKFGFRSRNAREVAVVNVRDLERVFDEGDTVDPDALREAGLIKDRYDEVKILGDGQLDKALTVQAHNFSSSARDKIESAGGTAEDV
ncbi:MAG: 50S ribosomal protein L15 [Persicimonas sp.]